MRSRHLTVTSDLFLKSPSKRSVIYTVDHNSETVLVVIKCDIPNIRGYFSLSSDRSVIVIKFDLIFSLLEVDRCSNIKSCNI